MSADDPHRWSADGREAYFERQLTDLEAEFDGRRTVQGEFARRLIRIAQYRARELEDMHSVALAAARRTQELELERMERRVSLVQDTVESQKRTIAVLERSLRDKRVLAESRESSDTESTVRFESGHRDWTVGQLEEIAYRARCAGAEDDTPVDISEWFARVSVPFPNVLNVSVPAKPDRMPPGDDPRADRLIAPNVKRSALLDAFPGPRWAAWSLLAFGSLAWVPVLWHWLVR